MGYVSSHVHTNRLLVWDTLEDFAAILTTWRWGMTIWPVQLNRYQTRGWLLQQDGQANTIARRTSATILGQDKLQVRILHHQGQALQYRDKDDMMNNWVEKMRNERMSPAWRRTQPYYQRWASAILVRTSAIPQYCGQPKRLRNCGLKKVAELRLRTFKIWLPQFRNSLPSLASFTTF
jgi:hypothetical protein